MKDRLKIILSVLVIILIIILFIMFNRKEEITSVIENDNEIKILNSLDYNENIKIVLYNNKEVYLIDNSEEKLIGTSCDDIYKLEDNIIEIVGHDISNLDLSYDFITYYDINNWKVVYRQKLKEVEEDLLNEENARYYIINVDNEEIPKMIIERYDNEKSEFTEYTFSNNEVYEKKWISEDTLEGGKDIKNIDF